MRVLSRRAPLSGEIRTSRRRRAGCSSVLEGPRPKCARRAIETNAEKCREGELSDGSQSLVNEFAASRESKLEKEQGADDYSPADVTGGTWLSY
jgi:hypothetical protein